MNERGQYGHHAIENYGYPAVVGADEPSGVSDLMDRYPRTTSYLFKTALLMTAGVIIAKSASENPKKALATGLLGGLFTSTVLSALTSTPIV